MDDLSQALPIVGAILAGVGTGLVWFCKRVEAYMEKRAVEDRQERNTFRDFLVTREEHSSRQLDAALATQIGVRDAIREHTAAIAQLTKVGEIQAKRLEEQVEVLRVLLQQLPRP